MLNSLSTIGSKLSELNLHVPTPFSGHLNARLITSKLFTAMPMHKISISKAAHYCRKCHSIQLLSDSSVKGRPATPPFYFMNLSDHLHSQHAWHREPGPQLAPCKISLHCHCWQSWASICSSREFSGRFHNAGRSEETRSVAIQVLRGEGAGRTPWQKKRLSFAAAVPTDTNTLSLCNILALAPV